MHHTLLDLIRQMQLEMIQAAFNAVPNHVGPDQNQRSIMAQLETKTGIRLIQDKASMFHLSGPRMAEAHGMFCAPEFDPRIGVEVVFLNIDATDSGWYSTLFHELAHATGTRARLNRFGISGRATPVFSVIDHCFEEIIAESVARRIMDRLGLATDATRERSAKYVEKYAAPMQYLIDTDKLQDQVEAAERLVLEWIDGIDFASNYFSNAA